MSASAALRQLSLATTKMQASVDPEHGIGWMVFNQPERRNALALEMWQAMGDILEQFEHDDQVRVVIMRGAGGAAFVSGADISEFDTKRSSAEQKRTYGAIAGRATRWLSQLSKPLIALIEGYCIGGGLATALAADIRIASRDATFGIPAARLGLGYEYSGLAKLARVVGPARARDIMLSARYFDAEEALGMGLIHFSQNRDDIEAFTLDYAATVGRNAPLTLKAAKAAVNAFERGGRDDEVAAVERLVDECFDSADYAEGRAAFQAKRAPKFTGR
ncbi:MAG: enoyl-CoA hydratase [Pseudomonadales bacterium]